MAKSILYLTHGLGGNEFEQIGMPGIKKRFSIGLETKIDSEYRWIIPPKSSKVIETTKDNMISCIAKSAENGILPGLGRKSNGDFYEELKRREDPSLDFLTDQLLKIFKRVYNVNPRFFEGKKEFNGARDRQIGIVSSLYPGLVNRRQVSFLKDLAAAVWNYNPEPVCKTDIVGQYKKRKNSPTKGLTYGEVASEIGQKGGKTELAMEKLVSDKILYKLPNPRSVIRGDLYFLSQRSKKRSVERRKVRVA
ncbi:hypothetical protein ACFLZZ_04150 [Nanoarchaeota archaeon]